MDRKRLLAASAVCPWQTVDGYSLRVLELLAGLSAEWEITLLSPGEAPDESSRNALGLAGWDLLPLGDELISVIHDEGGWTQEVRVAFQRAVDREQPDALLLWPGTEYVIFSRPDLPPAICDRIDSSTLTYWRELWATPHWRRRLTILRTVVESVLYERKILRSAKASVVVGSDDAKSLRRLNGGAAVSVVPNGVAAKRRIEDCKEADHPTVIFTGVLCYPPNVEAACHYAKDVLPKVRERVKDATFWIVGRDAAPEVLDLATLDGVEIRENVPDMSEVLGAAWLAVAPMKSGAGIKNKILEAWVLAKPVVLTQLASNGLEIPAELSRWVTGDAQEMADRSVELLESEDLRSRVGARSRELALTRHDWGRAAGALSKIIAGSLSAGHQDAHD